MIPRLVESSNISEHNILKKLLRNSYNESDIYNIKDEIQPSMNKKSNIELIQENWFYIILIIFFLIIIYLCYIYIKERRENKKQNEQIIKENNKKDRKDRKNKKNSINSEMNNNDYANNYYGMLKNVIPNTPMRQDDMRDDFYYDSF